MNGTKKLKNREGFLKIDYKEAVDFLLPRHYSGRKPNIKYAYGDFNYGKLKAVCTFGKPASNTLCDGVCGKENSKYVYELNRLCRVDDYGKQISKFVGWCLKELKKEKLIIVSYSDTGMNHNGYIYQALNFLFTGQTKQRLEFYTEGGHSRHGNKDNGKRKIRTAKNRYVYFCADKRQRKKWIKALNYKIEAYPKEENSNYVLGDFIKPTIVDYPNGFVKTKAGRLF
jgi:hypothetical protein